MKYHGFMRLAQQTGEYLASEWEWQSEDGVLQGDSKIEQLLLAAIRVRADLECAEYNGLRYAQDEESFKRLQQQEVNHPDENILIIWRQAPINNRRVDFLFAAFDYRNDKWRQLLVECDGHNFHERTKEQATRDKSKDRDAVLAGYDCFRFTGSEIWSDPWGCAEQITDWAAKGI